MVKNAIEKSTQEESLNKTETIGATLEVPAKENIIWQRRLERLQSDSRSGVLGLQTGAEGNGGKTIETLLTATLGIRKKCSPQRGKSLSQSSERFGISCCAREKDETILFLPENLQIALTEQVINNKKTFPASKCFPTGGFMLQENCDVYKYQRN